ncbi:hypothetical protein VTN77DRAFT_9315 [Rasamsonia byssochlamydoides]|uniref:uncharacterized protein n=1 Tax=Rasamsonia byssochlamydoides TaxID=89139 RepID=UPI003742D6E8
MTQQNDVIAIILIVFIITGVVAGYLYYRLNRPPRDVRSPPSTPPLRPPPPAPPPPPEAPRPWMGNANIVQPVRGNPNVVQSMWSHPRQRAFFHANLLGMSMNMGIPVARVLQKPPAHADEIQAIFEQLVGEFNPASYALLNPDHQTEHTAWETPTPVYWTQHGYVVVRADEAAEQPRSTGKVSLLGISYFAAMQWLVAAKSPPPKGLAAIVPWEGFSDLYRDAVRHGGILSRKFFQTWWDRQVASNQYGLPGRAARHYGPDTVDGDLSEEDLRRNRVDLPADNGKHRYRDDPLFASVNGNLEDVTVPVLSVANWGGIALHLRDAFLKGDDRVGWSKKGAVPAVDFLVRKGDVASNFARRAETVYQVLSLTEITGHITAHLNVSVTGDRWGPVPSDIDLFLTLRDLSPSGKEVFYTRSFGDPTPVTRGFLRVSLRKTNPTHPHHREWLPHRDYYSTDVPVIPNEIYAVDVEIWPTSVVVEAGGRLILEVASGDTTETGVWEHNDPVDRSPDDFQGENYIHFGSGYVNYLTLPVIPLQ